MKKALMRSAVVLAVIILSVAIGFGVDYVGTRIDLKTYPREYKSYVEKYSLLYGVPEYIIYSTIKTESDFRSNAVSGAGAVGLMQITPDTFDWLMLLQRESLDHGMLYDPETNIRYGTYFLSYLYNRYGLWDTVFAAYNCGMNRVDGWLINEAYAGENGALKYIPIKETREYVVKVNKAMDKYERLYGG